MLNKYIVRSQNEQSFEISVDPSSGQLYLGDEGIELDIHEDAGDYHVLHENKSYNVSIVRVDLENSNCLISVNGKLLELHVEDHYETLLKELGMDNFAQQVVKEIRAPMPGLVLESSVNVGDEVSEGQTLLILEAMKMENNITSPNEGIVKEVMVEKGQTVDKNDVLIRFE